MGIFSYFSKSFYSYSFTYIANLCSEGRLNLYRLHSPKETNKNAEEVRGIRMNGVKMYLYKDNTGVTKLTYILNFFNFDKRDACAIAGHIINPYYDPVLVNAFQKLLVCKLVSFQGICDTRLVYKAKNPQLLIHLNPDRHTQVSHIYSLESAIKKIEYSEIRTNLLSTLVPCCGF